MKDKLTLEDLAVYLPYGLKIAHYEMYTPNYIEIEPKRTLFVGKLTYLSEDSPNRAEYWIKDGRKNCRINTCVNIIKPILRPLSDLTKEIEVNGDRFVPIDIIDERHNLGVKDIIFEPDFLDCLPYWLVQYLIKWHFDINGLIESNLAIDINTLEE